MRAIHLVAFPLVLGLAAACGGSDTSNGNGNAGGADDGGGNEQGVTLEELPAKYGSAICEVFTDCAGDLLALFRPGEECSKTTQVTVEEGLAPLVDAIDAGRVKYHPAKVQACLDDVVANGCAQLDQREPASCQAAIEGTVARDGDCTLDAECTGDQYCKVADACPGKCAPYGAAGDACTSDDHCKSGLDCDDNQHCVAPAKLGELCQQGEPNCGFGLLCLGEDATAKTPGKCFEMAEALKGKLGDPCALEGSLCAVDYACEITSIAPIAGQCVAKVAADAPCHLALPDECPTDQYCKLGAKPLEAGVCTAKPGAGESCAAGISKQPEICAPYTRCDAGVCRDIAHAGEDCTQNDTCYSGHCVNGACVTGSSCQ